ncbi:MAG: AbrB/MazE/SpoVT family DNA-binding domain-containing protein [Sulfuricaulis sp.]
MLSPKRQVTIPKELCDRLHVHPGDKLDIIEHAGQVTLIKKRKGASNGVLNHLKADKRYTDAESLIDTVTARRLSTTKKK